MSHQWMRKERRELLDRVRALSTMRAAKFGKLPVDGTKWWAQIEQVAAENGVPMPTWQQWHEAGNQDRWGDSL